jgi:RNA polymerase sigma factor, sigma-70 family
MSIMTNEEMAVKIQNGQRELMAELWEQNKGVFNIKAFSLYNAYRDRCVSSGVELADVLQLCYFALCDAVAAYQAEGEYKLLSYLKFPLLKHFKVLLGISTSKREPLNQSVSLNEVMGGDDENNEHIDMLVDPASSDPFDQTEADIFNVELHDTLEKSISKLPVTRAAAVRGRYLEGKTQGQIAAELGISRQRIHTFEREALRKLRKEKALQEFHEETLASFAYKGTGLTTFRETGESSVERAVIRANELTDRKRNT